MKGNSTDSRPTGIEPSTVFGKRPDLPANIAKTALMHDPYELFLPIRQEWDKSERFIKLAEQVSGKVVTPAVKELRYSGRRLIETMNVIAAGGTQQVIDDCLRDTRLACIRSQHDAVDAATAKVAIDIDTMTDKIGYEVILHVYHDFAKLNSFLNLVRDRIAISRERRQERAAIYAELEFTDFPEMVKLYWELKSSEKIMKKMASRRRLSQVFLVGITIIATAIALFDHAPSLYHYIVGIISQ